MTRARVSMRKLRTDGINRGVSHNIKKVTKKKATGKRTKIRPFGEFPPSPKEPELESFFLGPPVKPADRVSMDPSPNEAINTSNKFFRCRDLNRKATVFMSKELKFELSNGSLHRSPAPTRRGPYKNITPTSASRPRPFVPPPSQSDLLSAIDALDDAAEAEASSSPARPISPSTPGSHSLRLRMDSSSDEGTPRRSPRKHQPRTPGSAVATPGGKAALPPAAARRRDVTPERQQPTQTPSTPTGTLSRRSPRKQQRPLAPGPPAVPTHAENEGPSRLTLTLTPPRRSPRKHPTSQSRVAASPAAHAPQTVYDRLEEELMKMEAGEDKENEAPGCRKEEDARFYSIFYRKPAAEKTNSANSPKMKLKSTTPKETRKSARVAALSGSEQHLEQLVIDAGQRRFGVITCRTCALVYTLGDPEDECVHARHHTGYLSALAYSGWKREHEVGQYADGRVVAVAPGDAPHAWRKVNAVLSIVDRELGFVGIGVRNKKQSKVYFYICARQIVGCLVAERIQQGFPMLARSSDGDGDGDAGTGERAAGVQCATTPQPCRVGVSRIWVHRDYRRRKLATRLVNAMRGSFELAPLQWSDVAFSDPTPDGLEFAAGVTGTQLFLVYNQ